jgi:Phage integrase family/Phosphotransferase enzyme family
MARRDGYRGLETVTGAGGSGLSPIGQRNLGVALHELNRDAAEEWIRSFLTPVAPIEVAHERPWSTVLRVPLRQGSAWFKACLKLQAFEPTLTARLHARWPDRVADVIGHDADRAWLLLADAGTQLRETGNPPEAWLRALPGYAELQRGEAMHGDEHLAAGVPDMRLALLPARFQDLVGRDLPLDGGEIQALRDFAAHFADLCAELDAQGVPPSVQHDDLHAANLYVQGDRLRVLDWGDASISHPFMSLVVTLALPVPAIGKLREHRTRQIKDRLLAGKRWQESGLVFTSRLGGPLDGTNVTTSFQRLLKRAGLPRKRFYDLRHSCATLLLIQGVPARVVMEILGHSQIGLTLNTYTHVLPEMQLEAARRMGDFLNSSSNRTERSSVHEIER